MSVKRFTRVDRTVSRSARNNMPDLMHMPMPDENVHGNMKK